MMVFMSAWAYTVCDVFTDAPLAGNPLAVFTDAADIPDAVLPLLQALGPMRSTLPVEVYNNGVQHAYVALEDEEAVARLTPNLGALARLVSEIGVNCFAGRGQRWKTRMFGPGLGVPEDPATGSAAGPLAVHLLRYSLIAPGDQIEISQGAEIGRPSLLHARVNGAPHEIHQVEVGGATVLVARGEILL